MQGLKILRKSKGLSRRAFSEIFNISAKSVYLYEKGEREPSFELLRKFKKFFNCTIDDLM